MGGVTAVRQKKHKNIPRWIIKIEARQIYFICLFDFFQAVPFHVTSALTRLPPPVPPVITTALIL